MAFGTHSIDDLLATTSTSVANFGEQTTYEALNTYLQAHNAILQTQLADLVETTTDRQRRAGGVDTMVMEDLDEYGRADAQKVATIDTVGFPLRQYGAALQWTRKYMLQATPAELAAQTQALATADNLKMQVLIKRAIFLPTNRTNVDLLVDKVTLAPVKALQNADGSPMMYGPNGEVFDGSTHTHYLARAGGSLVGSDVDSLVSTVTEHYTSGQALLYINAAQEATIRGFTNFDRYYAPGIQPAISAQYANRATLDVSNVGNRAIGLWNGTAEVWVKPWIPAGYLFAWIRGQQKPLVMRERSAGSSALQLDYDNEQFPLRAKQMSREVGFGAWTRTNGAVLYAGGTSYTAPSGL